MNESIADAIPGSWADAWTTPMLVPGEKAGIKLAQARRRTALLLLHEGDGFEEVSITAGELTGNPR